MATPLNNNRISIITKVNLRYEGILYNINAEDQKITLTQVRSFGTEGRRPGNEIPPSPEIHEYIVFKGADIADLKVLETPEEIASPSTQQQIQVDQPQVIEQSKQSVNTTSSEKKLVSTQVQDQPLSKSPTQPATDNQNNNIKPSKERFDITNTEKSTEEFDFTAMNKEFQKMAIQSQSNIKPGYSKDNFFDSLSSSTLEKSRETIEERNHQKEINKETFGQEYVDQGRQSRNYYQKNNYRGYGNEGGHKAGQNYRKYNNHNHNNNNYSSNYNNNNHHHHGNGNSTHYSKNNTKYNQYRYDKDEYEYELSNNNNKSYYYNKKNHNYYQS